MKKRPTFRGGARKSWLNRNAEESFPNLVKSNLNQIVFTMHRLIWNKTDVRLVPNQLENGKYNLISV